MKYNYASKIFALGMGDSFFLRSSFYFKNRQGLFVAKKCPVTEEFVFSKVENSNNGAILYNF
jgi:hypothetical protein